MVLTCLACGGKRSLSQLVTDLAEQPNALASSLVDSPARIRSRCSFPPSNTRATVLPSLRFGDDGLSHHSEAESNAVTSYELDKSQHLGVMGFTGDDFG